MRNNKHSLLILMLGAGLLAALPACTTQDKGMMQKESMMQEEAMMEEEGMMQDKDMMK